MSIFGIVLTVNTYITSILSIPPNLLMIYLSTTIGIKEIPEYRFIIIVQAVKDILDSAILSIINMGILQSPNGYTVIAMGILVKFNEHIGVIFKAFHSFLYIFDLLLMSIFFVYRYTVICDVMRLRKLFKPAGVAVLAITTLSLSAYTAITSTITFSISRNKTIDIIFGSENTLILSVPEDFYTPAIEHHSFNYQQIVSGLSAIIMMGVVIGGYVIVIITSKQIFSKLNKVRMSEKTKRLQKQLAILMISQALLPVICVVAPLAILFALVYSRINIGPYASFAAILFSWQPCPHVYISLCFVSPFRRRIRAIMHCRRIEASDLRTATAIIPSTKSVGGQFEGLTPIK